MKISAPMQRFILHWGEMGARWGVNRSIAQIHALLYLADDPLTAEDIAETLDIARSNVSNSLKELQTLGLISRNHLKGDRRDHFAASHEPWDMLMTIVEARKQREIDPTIAVLRECVAMAETDPDTPPSVLARLHRMQDFMATLTDWYEQVRKLPRNVLVRLMKLGARIASFVGG